MPSSDRELVSMTHPDHGGVAQSTRRAFERVWQDKGWQIVNENEMSTTVAENNTAEEEEL